MGKHNELGIFLLCPFASPPHFCLLVSSLGASQMGTLYVVSAITYITSRDLVCIPIAVDGIKCTIFECVCNEKILNLVKSDCYGSDGFLYRIEFIIRVCLIDVK